MVYIEINCKLSEPIEGNEIVIALMAELGCESFVENQDGVLAYIPKDNFHLEDFSRLKEKLKTMPFHFDFSYQEIEDKNWNQTWESNYQPVLIDNRCYIRAPFHQKKDDVDYQIVIEPKMSFGTAHHPTTSQLISYLLDEDCQNKAILDMGTGTGVLAILAMMRGGSFCLAIDNDQWAYENCLENVKRNNIAHLDVVLGDASSINKTPYDIVIANINRNILLRDLNCYAQALKSKGILFLSGFYLEPDLELLIKKAKEFHIEYQNHKEKEGWVAARFIKK